MDIGKLVSSIINAFVRAITAPARNASLRVRQKTNPHTMANKLTKPITDKINKFFKF